MYFHYVFMSAFRTIIGKAVRAYAHRKRLTGTVPELESAINAYMDYLESDTLTGYKWRVRRKNGVLEYEPIPRTDDRQLFLPYCEAVDEAAAQEQEKSG